MRNGCADRRLAAHLRASPAMPHIPAIDERHPAAIASEGKTMHRKLLLLATAMAALIAVGQPTNAALTDNALTDNALTDNALTDNALGSNALTDNALGSNAITGNALGSNGISPGALTEAPMGNRVVGIEFAEFAAPPKGE
jgi:hypothetical protein